MAKKKVAAQRKAAPVFFGIDLAWSPRNPSGAAAIRKGRLIEATGDLLSLTEIVDFVDGHLPSGRGAIVAVDAPLRVPNEEGSRLCDRALSAAWRRFHAGAYPANRKRLARDGIVRGEALVQLLSERLRFSEAAVIPRRTRERLVCEVYPHPALVSLFGLEQILKYKRGPVEARRRELARYQRLLRSLRQGDPPLKGTKKLLTSVDVSVLRGRALKAYEDVLDALTCAYTAYYLWRHGPARGCTYGSLEDGHILVPLPKS
ncbi:MAG: DUF429 domain-containing protein [Caldilineae bacterium]|nr:MAG: DUF429 domain-containing protein [Caldilineae bacterium]